MNAFNSVRHYDSNGIPESRDEKARKQDEAIVFPTISVANVCVLGLMMTTGVYEVFVEKVETRCCDLSPNSELPVNLPELCGPETKRSLANQIRQQIDDAKCFYTSEFIYKNNKGFKIELPRRLCFKEDKVERFRIREDDPRTQLRGQFGSRATTYIPAYTVLGIYRGLVLPMIVTDENLLHNACMGWQGSKEEWNANVSRFLLGFTLTVEDPRTRKKHDISLDVSAFGYDNPSSYINDPRLNPYKTKPLPRDVWNGSNLFLDDTDEEYYEVLEEPNVILARAFVCSFPFPFLVTNRPIQPGQELLLDYGGNHFRKDGRHSINTHQDNILNLG